MPDRKFTALLWNGKSSVACILPVVVYFDVFSGEESKTSPNTKKSFLPLRFAYCWTCGASACQNSRLTCLTVSTR